MNTNPTNCQCVGRRDESDPHSVHCDSAGESADVRPIEAGDRVQYRERVGQESRTFHGTILGIHSGIATIDLGGGGRSSVAVERLSLVAIDPYAPGAVYRCQIDISTDYRTHEAFVIIDALEEYASRQRWRAEDGDNAEFLKELADTADRLREQFHAQMHDVVTWTYGHSAPWDGAEQRTGTVAALDTDVNVATIADATDGHSCIVDDYPNRLRRA
ncbi:hypothetical protein [Mycolicibacterium fortuitum]|uniref:hypothetical protein n=1 Tax=Mycolicibacterium fortuitum TaxID=1766 RepID=UPI001CDCA346|nr:hypothetical protein [Mycolicibacterium fortuitum]UBV13059.1 hypothetical protein H8Z57_19510 [Mycolicibacterium fortuitum]